MDNAAPLKAVFFNQVLHYPVIRMGIDSQVLLFFTAEFYDSVKKPLHFPIPRNPVDSSVLLLRKPASLFYFTVGCILADDKCKHAMDDFSLFYHI